MRGLANNGRLESSDGRRRRLAARRITACLSALLALGVATPLPAAAETTVAVLLSASVKEYNEAVTGFQESFAGKIVARENMNGDPGKARKILDRIEREVKPDLIFAVGVWALQAVLERPSSPPFVYAMVLNPESVLGKSDRAAGASMNVSAEKTIDLLVQLDANLKRIGVVYNESKTGALVRRAEVAARARGLTLVTRAVGSAGEALPALNSLKAEGIDALWIVPDQTVLAPTVLKHVFRFSYANKVPTVGISERQAKMGALLAVSFKSPRDIGRQAGEIGRAVLAGKPAETTSARDVTLTVNLKVAKKLGVTVPQSLLVSASTVIR